MQIPLQSAGSRRAPGIRAVGVVLMVAMLASCATAPRQLRPVGLDAPMVRFSSGRVTVWLVDEVGVAMSHTRVDFSWESPSFYKTSSFTDNVGRVSFSGVPDVASISIDHPGGNYSRTLLVPQQGSAELRVILDTNGATQLERARLRSLVPASQ